VISIPVVFFTKAFFSVAAGEVAIFGGIAFFTVAGAVASKTVLDGVVNVIVVSETVLDGKVDVIAESGTVLDGTVDIIGVSETALDGTVDITAVSGTVLDRRCYWSE